MSIANLTREQWLELRANSIGASEAAAACGENPHDSALELWMYKTKRASPPDISDLERVFWGNVHEPAVVRVTCERLGLRLLSIDEAAAVLGDSVGVEILGVVEGRQLFLRSKQFPWMTATLDGIAQDPTDGSFGDIEAKSTDKRNAKDWDDGAAPDYYRLQVTHQLAVATPLSWGVLSCLVGGNQLQIVPRMLRADAPMEPLIELERQFWARVRADNAPEADGSPSSAFALKLLHPDDNGESVTLPEDMLPLCARERELSARMKADEAEHKRIKTLLSDVIGTNTYALLPNGAGSYSLKTTERDAHAVKASKYRRLLFSEPKQKK
jgi:predicted phage-related endonuclease